MSPRDVDADDLAAILDRVIPADDWPAVSHAGLDDHVARQLADPASAPTVERAFDVVRRMQPITDRSDAALDERLEALDWHDREALVTLAVQAYYGAADSVGASMIGFDPSSKRSPGAPVVEPEIAATPFDAVTTSYDAVVVGAGAGGGVAACVLAEAGLTVLLVERGEALGRRDVGRDHLRNHRAAIHGNNTGPNGPGNPRVSVGRSGRAHRIDLPHHDGWHNNAMTVGGGTRVYQGMAWRFLPDDFRLASVYGVPDDSSLADWPLTYDDLAGHYDWVEWNVGVCGDGTRHPAAGPRTRDFPMPPLPSNTEAQVLVAGAATLGLHTGPIPLLLNSVPRDHRAQCVRCGECVGFACPSDAKNGTQNTVIPRALATGNSTLVTRARAVTLTVDAGGRCDGVELLDERSGARRRVRAGHVVVAAGAVESARLLLTSRSSSHPDGIGNEHDQVGRHLQGHSFGSAFGFFDDEVIDMDGPGCSIATLDRNHANAGVIGGGVIHNEIIKLPIVHWNWAYHPDAPRWGAAAKAEFRHRYRRTSHLFCQVQEVPRADNRVTLADVVDSFGLPVARISGHAHDETIRTTDRIRAVAQEWLAASGATEVWTQPTPTALTAGQHQAGTCRMGVDPTRSVTDPSGRVHGHDNVWIADGSVHVTNGGVNPALTIMALAHRTASTLASHA